MNSFRRNPCLCCGGVFLLFFAAIITSWSVVCSAMDASRRRTELELLVALTEPAEYRFAERHFLPPPCLSVVFTYIPINVSKPPFTVSSPASSEALNADRLMEEMPAESGSRPKLTNFRRSESTRFQKSKIFMYSSNDRHLKNILT